MKKNVIIISILFVISLCLCFEAFSQVPSTPSTPSISNPQNPVPPPTNPFPPASNPQARPADSSVHISPSTNKPQPATITPVEPFPKSQEDTVFRSLETTPDPMKIDSLNRPK